MFALVVTVAMPTRDLEVRAVDLKNGIVIVAEPGGVRAVRLSTFPSDADLYRERAPWQALSCTTLHCGEWWFACRETGPGVLLDGLWTWLKQ